MLCKLALKMDPPATCFEKLDKWGKIHLWINESFLSNTIVIN